MLLIDTIRYLKRRADKRPVYLKNFIDQSHHHGTRSSDPSVEIIIPTRDKVDLLRACVESIFRETTYRNYRLTIVDNQSVEPATHDYLGKLKARGVTILQYPHVFNYSAICNLAAASTDAEYLCFLNNDTEVISPKWLGNLIDHSVQKEVGVVGPLLLYANKNVQHVGTSIGYKGIAGHVFAGLSLSELEHKNLPPTCFELSAVTFACAVTPRSLYQAVGGLDEDLSVGLNDVVFCLRMRSRGLRQVECFESSLIHHESVSRKSTKSSLVGALVAVREVLTTLRKYDWRYSDDYFEFLDK